MIWKEAVLWAIKDCAQQKGESIFTRKELVNNYRSWMIEMTQSTGSTPEQTISRELQELIEVGVIEFVSRGNYRLVDSVGNPRSLFQSLNQAEDITSRLWESFETSNQPVTEIGREVFQRIGQQRLREFTLLNYGYACAVCKISDPKLLVCSHIIPWSEEPTLRLDIQNTLSLCALHDKMFELKYFGFQSERVVKGPEQSNCTHTQGLVNELINIALPTKLHYKPKPAYLERHLQT